MRRQPAWSRSVWSIMRFSVASLFSIQLAMKCVMKLPPGAWTGGMVLLVSARGAARDALTVVLRRRRALLRERVAAACVEGGRATTGGGASGGPAAACPRLAVLRGQAHCVERVGVARGNYTPGERLAWANWRCKVNEASGSVRHCRRRLQLVLKVMNDGDNVN